MDLSPSNPGCVPDYRCDCYVGYQGRNCEGKLQQVKSRKLNKEIFEIVDKATIVSAPLSQCLVLFIIF